MKIGKIITIILAVLICGIMVFMLSQTPPKKEKAEASIQPKVEQNISKEQSKSSEEFASEDELKKVKELSLSVAKVHNEGVSKQYLTTCAPCHGANAKGVVAPDITHLSKDELLKKLADYKAGKVQNSLMKGLLTNVSDSELESLADEISKFKK